MRLLRRFLAALRSARRPKRRWVDYPGRDIVIIQPLRKG